MHEGYKLVVLSMISSAVVVSALLIYRYIYPKKKINLVILLTLICIPIIVNIFRPGAYESGDFDIHIYRTISFYHSLQEGHFLPSWAGELNATYGYPLFIFNYPFPYYIISLFHFIGFSFLISMKLFLASTFIVSGVGMYYAARTLFKNDFAAFTAAIFYQFAPYHLIDENFKIVIGELLIFTFLPFAFWSIQKLFQKKTFFFVGLLSICSSLLILAHVVLALFIMALFFCYAVIISIKKRKLSYTTFTVLAFILGSLSTVYIWLAPLVLSKYTIIQKMQLNPVDFISFWQLLYAPWRFGLLFQGPKGEISNLIGYSQLFILVIFIVLLLVKKIPQKYKSHILFWTIASLIISFLITEQSNFLWKLIPLLAITGNHRLFILLVFCIAILAGYLSLIYQKKKKLLYLLLFITIFSTILNWGQRDVIPTVTDTALIKNVPFSTAQDEGHFYANSIYRSLKDPWFAIIPKNHLDILRGSGEIKELSRTSTEHTYIINAATSLLLKENTLYFPGWQISSDKKPLSIGHNSQGVITFKLPKGLHFVKVSYTDIFIYRVLKLISVVSLLLIAGYLLTTLAWFPRQYK